MKTDRDEYRVFPLKVTRATGQSLVQVIVSLGVIAVLAVAVMTLLVSQASSIRYLEQRSESLEVKNLLSLTFQNADNCTCQINPNSTIDNFNDANLWFDSAVVDGSQSISVKKLKSGCALDAPILIAEGQTMNSGLIVDKIDLVNLKPTSNLNEWQGDWRVKWVDSGNLARAHKPIIIKAQRFVIDMVAPSILNHRLVSLCAGVGSQLRIESGTGVLPDNCAGGAPVVVAAAIPAGGWFCTVGSPYKDVTFTVPFLVPPKVMVTLAGPSANYPFVPCSGGAMDAVGTLVTNVTTTGFRGFSWFSPIPTSGCGVAIEGAVAPNRFDWIAIGN